MQLALTVFVRLLRQLVDARVATPHAALRVSSLALLTGLVATSCGGGGSGVVVSVVPGALAVDQASVTILVGAEPAGSALVPEAPRLFASDGESIELVLPDAALNTTVTISVEALFEGAKVGTGSATVATAAGRMVPVAVQIAPLTPVNACGNGVIEDGEGCDDQNTVPDDGCSAACAVEPGFKCATPQAPCTRACGDGVIDAPAEACDDGNTANIDGCTASCVVEPHYACTGEPSTCAIVAVCGDDVLDVGEACDDGALDPGDGCSPECTAEPGYVCDDDGVCRIACGDGVRAADEECDDGNTEPGDGCSADCTEEDDDPCAAGGNGNGNGNGRCDSTCGDGVVEGAETCDDGNTDTDDGCDAACAVEPGASCEGAPSECTRRCVVDGERVATGATDPTNPCRSCQPDVSVEGYSDNAPGSACGTNPDTCDGEDRCQRDAGGVLTCTPSDVSPCTTPTQPTCVEATDTCACTPASCDDGAACNGPEQCGADGQCDPGTPPCGGATPLCKEEGAGDFTCVECIESDDCLGNPAGSCCQDGVCTGGGAGACPCGEHDGGGGTCVAEGTCAPGFFFPFIDNDGDGVGGATRLTTCAALPLTPGLSDEGTDCNDADVAVDHLATVFLDNDSDAYAAGSEERCVGATLPAGVFDALPPVPAPGIEAAATEVLDGPGPTWTAQDLTDLDARAVDGRVAQSEDTDPTTATDLLVLKGFGLDVPADAQIVGVRVQLVRRESAGSTGDITDATVQLVVDGVPAGANRAQAAVAWPTSLSAETYGGDADTWGLTLTPAQVNGAGFGVAVAVLGAAGTRAEIDGARIDVYVSAGTDCNDADATVFARWTALTDNDRDGFAAAGTSAPRCIGDAPAQPGLTRLAPATDCYDQSASAFPGQTAFFPVHRGDQNFDYDCDSTEAKEAVADVASCAIAQDACGGMCPCAECATTLGAPAEPPEACGASHDAGACGGDCCTEQASSVAVACR